MNQQSTNKISNFEYDINFKILENSSAKESIATGKIISIENEIVTIDKVLK